MDTIAFNGKIYFYSRSANREIFYEIIRKKTPNQANKSIPKQPQILKQLALTALGVGGAVAAGFLFYQYKNSFRSLKGLAAQVFDRKESYIPATPDESSLIVEEAIGTVKKSDIAMNRDLLAKKTHDILNKTLIEKTPIGMILKTPATPLDHSPLTDDELRRLSDKEFSQLTLASLGQRTLPGQQNIILERVKNIKSQPILSDDLKNVSNLPLGKFSRLKADQINPLIDQIPAEAFFLIDNHELEGLNLAKASKAQIENLLFSKERVFYLSGHQIHTFLDKLDDSHLSHIPKEQFKQIVFEKLTNEQRKRLLEPVQNL